MRGLLAEGKDTVQKEPEMKKSIRRKLVNGIVKVKESTRNWGMGFVYRGYVVTFEDCDK